MSRGHDRERQVRVQLEADGFWVIRAAGSLGDADLVAAKPGRLLLVEVKSTLTPWSHFGPADRHALLMAAEKAGGEAWLAWWPKRGSCSWLPSWEWPAERSAVA